MRVAVIGSGISGLGAAYLLSRAHEVEVFERDGRAGGHANTVVHRGLALDTGFLVHNEQNYPLLCRLFRELGVATQETEMSFSVCCAGCGLEYSGRRPFAQPRNATRPCFLALLAEIGRWLRTAKRALEHADYESRSLAAYLDDHGYSARFRAHFLVPLTASLWSTAPGRALEFPAAAAIRFFANHGMLGFRRFRWRAVSGGSHAYVGALARPLGDRLHLALGVRSLRRDPGGVEVRTDDGRVRRFDAAVVAVHADQALAMLEDPSPAERRVLGAFEYTVNDTVLHTDGSLLPRARAARASWNYRTRGRGRPTLTYSLNRLQRLETEREYCVSLNQEIPQEHVLARFAYSHPLLTVASLQAQRELPGLGGSRTVYAGAHFGNGFHEDGLASRRRSRRGAGGSVVRSALYTGTLVHSRRSPVRNVFRYPISFWLFDLDELSELERRLRLFSVNRRNLVALRDRDHFDGARPVKRAVLDYVDDASVERVLMLTQPRVLGYVFNPVSFYWCYRGDGSLACMVAELNNTFGERLPELLRGPELRYEHEKHLHVSPFFGLDQDYEYRFSQPAAELWARIHVRDRDGHRPLTAVLHGYRRELTNASLAHLLLRYPLMPVRITALIHWQALKLRLRGVPYHPKPRFVPGQGSVHS